MSIGHTITAAMEMFRIVFWREDAPGEGSAEEGCGSEIDIARVAITAEEICNGGFGLRRLVVGLLLILQSFDNLAF